MQNQTIKAAAFGIIAGMRSMAAPALLTRRYSNTLTEDLEGTPFAWVSCPAASLVFQTMAACELAVDKLPATPDRISPLPLAARALSGALCGATVFAASKNHKVLGAAIGAGGAVMSAYLFFYARKWAAKSTPLSDTQVAAIEDVIVFGLSRQIE